MRVLVVVLSLLACPTAAQVVDATQPPYNAKGDCKTDAAPAIMAAMATGKRVYLPHGDYLIASPIALSQTYAVLEGDGWSERGIAQHPHFTAGCTTEPGTYISVIDPAVAAFTFSSPVGNSGPKFRHLAFLEKQPAAGPGWAPTVYPPVVTLDGSRLPNSGALFEDIGFGAVYDAIYAKGNAARIQLNTIYGQVFDHLLAVDDAQDVSRASDVHLWGFWSGTDHVYTWQSANTEPFFFKRQDSFQADNIFVFGARACVRIGHWRGANPGTSTAIHFGNLNCDAAKYALWIDSTSQGAVIAVDHLWHGGETCCTTPQLIAGSNTIQIDGQAATVDVSDIHTTNVQQSVVNITNEVVGSIIRLDSVDASGGLNYPGMSISNPFSGNSPVFNVVSQRRNSVLSVVHPIQPQNAGYTNGGVSSGIINTGSNAILYSGNGQASWYTLDMNNRGTYTWPNWAETLRAAPAGTIAGATVYLPAVALDGRKLTLVCKNTIIALTVKSPVGLINAPNTCRAGHHIDFQYSLPDNNYWALN